MSEVKAILIRRDGITPDEADERIAEFRSELASVLCEHEDNPIEALMASESLVQEHFGLEPDYLSEYLPV